MKTTILILSIFILLRPVFPAVEYVARFDYIKNELCVNKDKPELECNGTCHLKKELAKAAQEDNPKDKLRPFSLDHQLVYIQNLYTEFLVSLPLTDDVTSVFSYRGSYNFSYSSFIFKPPLIR